MCGCQNWSRRFLPDSRFGQDLVQILSRLRYMAVQIKKSGQHVRTCCPDSGLVQTAFSYDPCFFLKRPPSPFHHSRPPQSSHLPYCTQLSSAIKEDKGIVLPGPCPVVPLAILLSILQQNHALGMGLGSGKLQE
jgi:hypothetical protein